MLAPGSWIHTKRTVNCLLNSGHHVSFIDAENPLPEGRANFNYLGYPRSGRGFYRKLLGDPRANKISEFFITTKFRRIWRTLKPDIVHVCWLDERASQCAKAGMRPLILSIWGTDLNSKFLSDAQPESVKVAAEGLAGVDLTVVDAPDMHAKCALLAGRAVRTEELHLGADMQLFKPVNCSDGWRQKLGIAPDAKVLLSMRAMDEKYRHHLILEAFSRALKRVNTTAFLLFKVYNQSNPTYLNDLRDRARKDGIDQFVRFIDEVPQEKMPELYSLADGVLSFPQMDAFPVTFVEAAACERMVITGKLPSYAGTFAEEYFRMVGPDDVEGLARAIAELLSETAAEQRNRKDRLSQLRVLVTKEYDEKLFARRLSDLYKDVSSQYRKSLVVAGGLLYSQSLF
jgi:glycosyltransferase involved in cell wall biosynthesis